MFTKVGVEDQLSCMYNNKYERQTALCLPASQGVLRHWKGDGGGGGGGGRSQHGTIMVAPHWVLLLSPLF